MRGKGAQTLSGSPQSDARPDAPRCFAQCRQRHEFTVSIERPLRCGPARLAGKQTGVANVRLETRLSVARVAFASRRSAHAFVRHPERARNDAARRALDVGFEAVGGVGPVVHDRAVRVRIGAAQVEVQTIQLLVLEQEAERGAERRRLTEHRLGQRQCFDIDRADMEVEADTA